MRYHPDHGRTILLLRDDDTSSLHNQWDGDRLLFRAGGYWWDGATWYRPGQVWDPVAQDYERRKARAAVTITAAYMLDNRADPDKASIGKVGGLDPAAPTPDNWADHLALWAACRPDRDDALPLDRCVVDVTSPELTGAQLIGVAEMAELGGRSTLGDAIGKFLADTYGPLYRDDLAIPRYSIRQQTRFVKVPITTQTGKEATALMTAYDGILDAAGVAQ
ncbi:hypothetical protein ACWGIN_31065 [Streptomyces sp. NPDC054861]